MTGFPLVARSFRHGRKDDSVLFIDASEKFEPGRKRNVLRDEHIKEVVEASLKWSEIPQYARLVRRAEIEANRFNLSLSRYFDGGASFEVADPEDLFGRRWQTFKNK